ncbi:hypothetical protein KIPE111705_42415 [Kibdelosporangium persicum]|uniref:hypothetical protein n=1 Tax=Kibdelosporangium persicum TaxID=2698649 RepID=UPI0015633BC5|nr:hypothetical protein [Kibdelosporangium persicum]
MLALEPDRVVSVSRLIDVDVASFERLMARTRRPGASRRATIELSAARLRMMAGRIGATDCIRLSGR